MADGLCSPHFETNWTVFTEFLRKHCTKIKTLKISLSCFTMNRSLCFLVYKHSCWSEFLFHNWKYLTQYYYITSTGPPLTRHSLFWAFSFLSILHPLYTLHLTRAELTWLIAIQVEILHHLCRLSNWGPAYKTENCLTCKVKGMKYKSQELIAIYVCVD